MGTGGGTGFFFEGGRNHMRKAGRGRGRGAGRAFAGNVLGGV